MSVLLQSEVVFPSPLFLILHSMEKEVPHINLVIVGENVKADVKGNAEELTVLLLSAM